MIFQIAHAIEMNQNSTSQPVYNTMLLLPSILSGDPQRYTHSLASYLMMPLKIKPVNIVPKTETNFYFMINLFCTSNNIGLAIRLSYRINIITQQCIFLFKLNNIQTWISIQNSYIITMFFFTIIGTYVT